jgi:hypothetical protein
MPERGPLPPIPEPPRRNLTPPGRRQSGTFDVDSDAPTPRKPVDLAVYQSLLSVFDEMTPAQRVAFADFAHLYKALDDEGRKRLLDLAIEMNGLG